MPVASARSLLGNHSATALMADGKFPASPRPSAKRTIANPMTAPDRLPIEPTQWVVASPGTWRSAEARPPAPLCSAEADSRHTYQRMADGGERPDTHRSGVADPRAYLVDKVSGEKEPDRIGRGKDGDDRRELDFRQADATRGVLQNRFQQSQDLAIHVVQRGRKKQQAADSPAIAVRPACHAIARRCCVWSRGRGRNFGIGCNDRSHGLVSRSRLKRLNLLVGRSSGALSDGSF